MVSPWAGSRSDLHFAVGPPFCGVRDGLDQSLARPEPQTTHNAGATTHEVADDDTMHE